MKKVFIALAALGLALGTVAGEASAQVVCRDCIEFFYFPPDGDLEGIRMHAFVSPTQPCQAAINLNGANGINGGDSLLECVRCGGTSDCHLEDMMGSCHIACGPAGDDPLLLAVSLAVDASDGAWLRDLTDRNSELTFDSKEGTVRVHNPSGCHALSVEETSVSVPQHLRRLLETE